MIPEIELLIKQFDGKTWNTETQVQFMNCLADEDFYLGEAKNDPAFSARDRINRAPKSLGFVVLKPKIKATPAGEQLIVSSRKDEIFLRQLMKFQIPSPYHNPSDSASHFYVKPYLEILRLIRTLGGLTFDELQIFGMQLVDYHLFNRVVSKIKKFRIKKKEFKGNYKKFREQYLMSELKRIYKDDLAIGNTKTRESRDASTYNFLKTKGRNMHDYADACVRYLSITGLVNVTYRGKTISIATDREQDVDYILANVERKPLQTDNEKEYAEYLGNAKNPVLLTDNKDLLAIKIKTQFPDTEFSETDGLDKLKDLYSTLLNEQKEQNIRQKVNEIKENKLYDDIQDLFAHIGDRDLYNAPLLFEWNTWRAMTMIDGGDIKANLVFDDHGEPLYTAGGNKPDIICDYGDYMATIEVTLQSGSRQFESEGESVARHLGRLRTNTNKPCFSLFIAPVINNDCISYFYGLHRINITTYGGKSVIIPLPLSVFIKMLASSYKNDNKPNPGHIKRFFETSARIAEKAKSEREWYDAIQNHAIHWLE